MELATCMCGHAMLERDGREIRLSCFHCREAVAEHVQVPRGRLLVVQTFGEDRHGGIIVLRDKVQIVRDYEPGNREGNRGGTELDPSVLTAALDLRRERMIARRLGRQ